MAREKNLMKKREKLATKKKGAGKQGKREEFSYPTQLSIIVDSVNRTHF